MPAAFSLGAKSMRRLTLVTILALFQGTTLASVPAQRVSGEISLDQREAWTSARHGSAYSAVAHSAARTSCAAVQPPEALATPNPLLDQPDPLPKITVSFIIGTDGRVHSPLVLESAGPAEDRTVLETVSAWRYRPAMCNGVPTEAEGKIEFSSR